MVAISDFDPVASLRCLETMRSQALGLRRRADVLRENAVVLRQASADAIREAQKTCLVARTLCGSSRSISVVAFPQPPSILLQALAARRLDQRDIEGLADGLIAAYQDAAAFGDEEAQSFLRNALMQMGRHLAERLGPRAAGVRLH